MPACRAQSNYPDKPGTLFIRQQICDLNDFKKGFFSPKNDLKGRGFLSYGFYRDPGDPKTYIITLTCTDLNRAVTFIQSSNFYVSCVGAGLGLPVIWAGEDEKVSPYTGIPPKPGAIVVARVEVGNPTFWEKAWKDVAGYSMYELPERPGVVILSRKMPDMAQARAFVRAQSLKSTMEAEGVTRMDFWVGGRLEEGAF